MVPVVGYAAESDAQRDHRGSRSDHDLVEATEPWRREVGEARGVGDGNEAEPRPDEGAVPRREGLAALCDCGRLAGAAAVHGHAPREKVGPEAADVDLHHAGEEEGDYASKGRIFAISNLTEWQREIMVK